MRALVTGSAGFLGRHFVAELQCHGWHVTGLDVAYEEHRPQEGLRAFGIDALRMFQLTSQGWYDLVIHAAARAPHRAAIDGQPASHVYNQLLDAAMFEWAVRTRQGRVLYLSSCAALDVKPDDYGRVKLTGERMARQVRAAGVPVTVVRPFSGYGEDQGTDWPFGAFVARARRRDDPFTVWNANAVRDWIHVDDVVAGALAVAESGTDEPVSLCTGVGTSMQDLISMMAETVGYAPALEHHTDKPAGAASRIGDPTVMRRYHEPTVRLADGVVRALGQFARVGST